MGDPSNGLSSDSNGISANKITREVLAGIFNKSDADIKSYLNDFKEKENDLIKSQKPFSGWSIDDVLPQECRIN